MWTKAFWAATAERAIKSAAQGVIFFWGVGDGLLNAWAVNWKDAGGIALGMFLLSILTSLVSQGVTERHGPSLTNSEQVIEKIHE